MKEYCPQCIEVLVKDRKKLGTKTNWLICPKCGFRKRPDSNIYLSENLRNFKHRIEQRNKNLNQFNTDIEN